MKIDTRKLGQRKVSITLAVSLTLLLQVLVTIYFTYELNAVASAHSNNWDGLTPAFTLDGLTLLLSGLNIVLLAMYSKKLIMGQIKFNLVPLTLAGALVVVLLLRFSTLG